KAGVSCGYFLNHSSMNFFRRVAKLNQRVSQGLVEVEGLSFRVRSAAALEPRYQAGDMVDLSAHLLELSREFLRAAMLNHGQVKRQIVEKVVDLVRQGPGELAHVCQGPLA